MDGKAPEPEFNEHPKSNNAESAWSYFLREKEGAHAKCKICGKILKASGGTTSGLHTHLKQIHKINLLKRSLPKSQGSSKIASSMSEESFIEKDSLPSSFARMTASDGLSFNIISTSYDIREGLTARGFKEVPSCPKTIRKIVVEYSQSIRSQLTKKLADTIKNGDRLCLTLDEWTSTRNRRYMNVNVHAEKEFWNLGLIRVHGSMPSEKCIDLMKEKLNKHGLSLDKHIIAITTDGAAVMVKIGKLIDVDQQLCFAHGIHLAVKDVLYTNSNKNLATGETEDDNFDTDEGDSTDEEDALAIDETVNNSTYEESHEIFSLIAKVRAVVKKFRNSPVKNDSILQKYVKDEFNQELALILDTKIRWNSLLAMLERFYRLRTCIQKSLIDIKSNIQFSESEFESLSNITSVLLPIKLAVEAICRQDASLLTADVAIKFMFECLNENPSPLSAEFQASLKRRIKERRSDLSSLLQYLHNQYQPGEEGSSTKKTNSAKECFDDIFPKMNKTAIVKKIVSIVERLHREEECAEGVQQKQEKNGAEKLDVSLPETLSLQQKLQLALSKQIPSASNEATDEKTPNSVLKIVKREILTFEELNVRGKYLRMVYDHLLSVPPSSVEAERAFSAAGIICTKIRSRMDDHTLDALCFLRAHFNVNKTKKKHKQ